MMGLELFFALVMLAALIAYALLGCADFGGGIWDLLSAGPRAADQRRQIAQAIGPVWEANHVWLIFLIVVLFTCFPAAYAAVSVALFWPLHLILVGIVLRGASFVFRAYGSTTAAAERTWSRVFGIASAATPLLLGICLGAISTGDIRAGAGGAVESWRVWLAPFPIVTGLLAFMVSAYLAAVYLAWESTGELQEDFRRRALLTWLVAGAMSIALLVLARLHAPRLWEALTTLPAAAFVAGGVILAPASALALLNRRYGSTRVLAGAQVVVLLIGWGVAQHPYLIAPDLTIAGSAAPKATLALTAMTLPFGAGVLIPSLWYLFAVFKGKNPEA
jgi:cytochrome bd ubiquinol oxidase subunit II